MHTEFPVDACQTVSLSEPTVLIENERTGNTNSTQRAHIKENTLKKVSCASYCILTAGPVPKLDFHGAFKSMVSQMCRSIYK